MRQRESVRVVSGAVGRPGAAAGDGWSSEDPYVL